MWTLHKLQARQRKRSPAETQGSPAKAGLPSRGGTHGSVSSKDNERKSSGTRSESREIEGERHSSRPWNFTLDELERFPALKKRNFWCIQRHQARALHYDLRMQLDGATVSWAIPRGLLGMSKRGDANRLAVQTTLHPISYTTHEGADGRTLPSGERAGTLLWDIGTYTIGYAQTDEDSESDEERRRKRRRGVGLLSGEDDSDDPTGQHEEDKFRMSLNRPLKDGRSRSIHFTLKGGYKMKDHSFILILTAGHSFAPTYSTDGRQKKTWFVRLPRGVDEYTWGPHGEEGKEYNYSVKTGRTLKQVCHDERVRAAKWENEMVRFAGWFEDLNGLEEGRKAELQKER